MSISSTPPLGKLFNVVIILGKDAPVLNFTFEQPVEIHYIKFDLISFWGVHGGGLQYFAASK